MTPILENLSRKYAEIVSIDITKKCEFKIVFEVTLDAIF